MQLLCNLGPEGPLSLLLRSCVQWLQTALYTSFCRHLLWWRHVGGYGPCQRRAPVAELEGHQLQILVGFKVSDAGSADRPTRADSPSSEAACIVPVAWCRQGVERRTRDLDPSFMEARAGLAESLVRGPRRSARPGATV